MCLYYTAYSIICQYIIHYIFLTKPSPNWTFTQFHDKLTKHHFLFSRGESARFFRASVVSEFQIRNHKNNLFLMIFGNKTALLHLYNAMRGTNYTNPDDLTITTIDGVLYLGMKNDISFIISNELNLFEAQSTWNPNMPLRGLLYFARLYEGYIAEHELSIYSKSLLKLPKPRYIVFYNGTRTEPDSKLLKLSDSFISEDGEEACLECTATMININYGHNQELMNNCQELHDYSFLVQEIRNGQRMGMSLSRAVDHAVQVCIENNVLKTFLMRHRAEVKHVILTEFDMEKQLKLERKDGYAAGREEGEELFSQLIKKLLADSRSDDLEKALNDPKSREVLYQEYGIIGEQDF